MRYAVFFVLLCTSYAIAANFTSLQLDNDTSLASNDQFKYPPGTKFLGIGYDILKGNPNSKLVQNAGVDPGYKAATRILKLTVPEVERLNKERTYKLYTEMYYTVRDSKAATTTTKIISDEKSYQDELKTSVEVQGSYDGGLFSASFAASAEYKEMSKETMKNKNIYFEKTVVHLYGNVKYLWSTFRRGTFTVTRNFAAAICSLPEIYEKNKYRAFIDTFGTHVVTRLDVGTKEITMNKTSMSDFSKYALEEGKGSLCASGKYGGAEGSVKVNFAKLKESMKKGTTFRTEKREFKIGTKENPEPIKSYLQPLTELFELHMYDKNDLEQLLCTLTTNSLKIRHTNLLTFFKDYPGILQVTAPKDRKLVVKVDWPEGRYALPMPIDGCPENGDDFSWNQGYFIQDLEDKTPFSYGSTGNHLGIFYQRENSPKDKDAKQSFCTKTRRTTNHRNWPKGSYCIAMKGKCPNGFQTGSITWYDETFMNFNSKMGSLPKHEQQGGSKPFTTIHYCCRKDNPWENAIWLPFKKPFLLYMAPGERNCQKVYKMEAKKEYFAYDVSDKSSSSKSGMVPGGTFNKNIKLYYCYYTCKACEP